MRWLDRSRPAFNAGRLRLSETRPDALVQARECRIIADAVELGEHVTQDFGEQGDGLRGLVNERAVRTRREHEDRDGEADNTAKCDLKHPIRGGEAERSGSMLLGLAKSKMAAVTGAMRML